MKSAPNSPAKSPVTATTSDKGAPPQSTEHQPGLEPASIPPQLAMMQSSNTSNNRTVPRIAVEQGETTSDAKVNHDGAESLQNTEQAKTPPAHSPSSKRQPKSPDTKVDRDESDPSQNAATSEPPELEHNSNISSTVIVVTSPTSSSRTASLSDEEQANLTEESCCIERSKVASGLFALEDFNSIIGFVTSILSYRTGGGIHENIDIALVWVGVGYWNVFVDTPRCISSLPDLKDVAKQDPNPKIGWGLYVAHIGTFCFFLPATVTATLWLATREFISNDHPNSTTLGPAYLYVLCDAGFAIGQLVAALSDMRNRQLLLTQAYRSASYNQNFGEDGNQRLYIASFLSNLFGCFGGISSGWSMVDLKNPEPSALLSIVFFAISAVINVALLGARVGCVVDVAINTCNKLSGHVKAAVNWCSTFSSTDDGGTAVHLISEAEQQAKYDSINDDQRAQSAGANTNCA